MGSNYFEKDGKPFYVIGVHYIPRTEGMQWWWLWNPREIEEDFAHMAELGLNAARIDVITSFIEPRPGQYNEKALKRFEEFFEMAREHDILVHPALLVGYELGDWWDVPWRHGRNPYEDIELLELQIRHVRMLAERFKDKTNLLAWDLTDEPPIGFGKKTKPPMGEHWTRVLCNAIRNAGDKHPLTIGTVGQELIGGPFRADLVKENLDLVCVHPYPFFNEEFFPDPLISIRATYDAAFEVRLSLSAGKPVLISEFGASTTSFSEKRVADYYRILMWSSLINGACGVIAWMYADPVHREWGPFVRIPATEIGMGITREDGTDKPAAAQMKEFSEIVAKIDLSSFKCVRPSAGIVVPREAAGSLRYSDIELPEPVQVFSVPVHTLVSEANHQSVMRTLLNSFNLAKEAHLDVSFPREDSLLEPYGLIITPGQWNYYLTFGSKILDYVKGGGAYYLSISGDYLQAAVPNLTHLCGVLSEDVIYPERMVKIRIKKDFYCLKQGEAFEIPAAGTGRLVSVTTGDLIAVDDQDRPAIITNKVGKGKTLLITYPIERYLSEVPNVYSYDTCYRIYKAIKQWAGINDHFDCSSPFVEMGTLANKAGNSRYLILINHSGIVVKDILKVAPKPTHIRDFISGMTVPFQKADGETAVPFQLEPCGVKVFSFSF
jgi:endo-1,4-beta-mannosidase